MFERLRTWTRENRLKALIYGVVGLAVFGFLSLEMIHFSSSPPFCRAMCHNMALEVDQLEKTAHGKRGVDCVGCHYRPGLWGYTVTKMGAMVSFKNSVLKTLGLEMHDPHEQETLEHHYERPAPFGIILTDELIEEERKMDHPLLWQYIHNEEKDLGFWGGPSKFADEKGNYRIQIHRHNELWNNIEVNCRNCHSSVGNRGHFAQSKVADFVVRNTLLSFKGESERRRKGIVVPHAIHLDKGVGCIDCHQEIAHGPDELMDGNGVILPTMEICFACHNDRRASKDCTLCHEYQKNMGLGITGAGVEDAPGFKYPANVQCTDCHLEENGWKMKPAICVGCHGDEAYGETMGEWQKSTKDLLAEVEPLVEQVGTALEQAKARGRNVDEASKLYNDGLYNYEFAANDGSKGVHNIDYATALLNAAKEKLTSASERIME